MGFRHVRYRFVPPCVGADDPLGDDLVVQMPLPALPKR